jgi:hypothetical protein
MTGIGTDLLAAFPEHDRFRLVRCIGQGGFGVVFEAEDARVGGRVALKTLKVSDAAGLLQFKHEFRALADVVHPNLVGLHELLSAGDRWFFTMELVDGVPLHASVGSTYTRSRSWSAGTPTLDPEGLDTDDPTAEDPPRRPAVTSTRARSARCSRRSPTGCRRCTRRVGCTVTSSPRT